MKKWDNLWNLNGFALGCGLLALWLYSYHSCQNTMQIDSYLAQVSVSDFLTVSSPSWLTRPIPDKTVQLIQHST
jgi:hypothetical protein